MASTVQMRAERVWSATVIGFGLGSSSRLGILVVARLLFREERIVSGARMTAMIGCVAIDPGFVAGRGSRCKMSGLSNQSNAQAEAAKWVLTMQMFVAVDSPAVMLGTSMRVSKLVTEHVNSIQDAKLILGLQWTAIGITLERKSAHSMTGTHTRELLAQTRSCASQTQLWLSTRQSAARSKTLASFRKRVELRSSLESFCSPTWLISIDIDLIHTFSIKCD